MTELAGGKQESVSGIRFNMPPLGIDLLRLPPVVSLTIVLINPVAFFIEDAETGCAYGIHIVTTIILNDA